MRDVLSIAYRYSKQAKEYGGTSGQIGIRTNLSICLPLSVSFFSSSVSLLYASATALNKSVMLQIIISLCCGLT